MNNALKIAFAATLKKYRVRKNLSQEDLSFACGITRAHLSDLENGQIDPGFYTVFKIANGLKMKASDFIDAIEHEL